MEAIQSTLTLTRSLYGIISAVKNGPDIVRRTAENILRFQSLLERVEHLCAGNSTCLDHSALLSNVKSASEDIETFTSKVKTLQLTSGQRVAGRLWRRLKTVVGEQDLDAITAKISEHSARISVDLQLIESKHSSRTAATISRIEQTSTSHMNMTTDYHTQVKGMVSQYQQDRQELMALMDSLRAMVAPMESLPSNLTNVFQDVLAQASQHVHPASSQPTHSESGIVGEISGDGSLLEDVTPIQPVDEALLASIKRLGQLVQDKERQFDTFHDADDEAEDIIQALSHILKSAEECAQRLAQERNDTEQGQDHRSAARAIASFHRAHGRNRLLINSEGQSPYGAVGQRRLSKDLKREHSWYEVPLSQGLLRFKRRRITTRCACGEANCAHCQIPDEDGARTECVTTVTFMPPADQYRFMIIASEYASGSRDSPFISSISYLAVNPVLPRRSKVFEVVASGNLQALREMLRAGEASLRDTDEGGQSLLFYAIEQPSIARYLLHMGLDVDHVGEDESGFTKSILQASSSDIGLRDPSRETITECRELFIDAGADPLALFTPPDQVGSFLFNQAAQGTTGIIARMAKRAVCNGLLSIRDILQHREGGRNLLHMACGPWHEGPSIETLSALLAMGFDIKSPNDHGATCLGEFLPTLHRGFCSINYSLSTQRVLVFLLDNGADPFVATKGSPPLSERVYKCGGWLEAFLPTGWAHGSHCGDLWDSALSLCGKDITKLRERYPRKAMYTEHYPMEAFEAFWKGRESECPYWDDQPWPPSTGQYNGLHSCTHEPATDAGNVMSYEDYEDDDDRDDIEYDGDDEEQDTFDESDWASTDGKESQIPEHK